MINVLKRYASNIAITAVFSVASSTPFTFAYAETPKESDPAVSVSNDNMEAKSSVLVESAQKFIDTGVITVSTYDDPERDLKIDLSEDNAFTEAFQAGLQSFLKRIETDQICQTALKHNDRKSWERRIYAIAINELIKKPELSDYRTAPHVNKPNAIKGVEFPIEKLARSGTRNLKDLKQDILYGRDENGQYAFENDCEGLSAITLYWLQTADNENWKQPVKEWLYCVGYISNHRNPNIPGYHAFGLSPASGIVEATNHKQNGLGLLYFNNVTRSQFLRGGPAYVDTSTPGIHRIYGLAFGGVYKTSLGKLYKMQDEFKHAMYPG